MKLYHVTFDLSEPKSKTFYPRIPKTAGPSEDVTIERICLSPSLEGCLQALPIEKRNLLEGETFRVYSIDIDENDPNLVHPKYLLENGLVPDALENQEHWYKKSIEMDSFDLQIKEIRAEYEIAFSCIKKENLEDTIRNLASEMDAKNRDGLLKILEKNLSSVEDIYGEAIDYLDEIEDYEAEDELFEQVACVPWGMGLKINKLQCA